MRKIHYLNIGQPKCGTTWLFDNLSKHKQVDFRPTRSFLTKENVYTHSPFFDPEVYRKQYEKYDVSMNFNTFAYGLDYERIKELTTVVTHCSIILRNPFDLYQSFFNFKLMGQCFSDHDHNAFDTMFPIWVDLSKSLGDWLYLFPKMKILFYEDLVLDQNYFYSKVLHNLGLDPELPTYANKINTNDNKQYAMVSDKTTKRLCDQIQKIQSLIKVDLTHWLTQVPKF